MSEYHLLDRAVREPIAFVRDIFRDDELWRPSPISVPDDMPGKDVLCEAGLPLMTVSEIADVGMGFDPGFQIRQLCDLHKSDKWGLNERFGGMYCIKQEGHLSFTCVSGRDSGAVFLFTTEPVYGEYYVNGGVDILGVALAAYRAHLTFTSKIPRHEIWSWDERFFAFMSRLDARSCGPNETYWSRVQEFLSFR